MPTTNLFMRILKANSPEELQKIRDAIKSKYAVIEPSEIKDVTKEFRSNYERN